MQITVTFRHVDPTPALRPYAEDKVARVARKYLRRPVDAHVILGVSKQRHVAEITLQARPRLDVRQGGDARSLLGDRPRGREARAPGPEAEGDAAGSQGRRHAARRAAVGRRCRAARRGAPRVIAHASACRRSRCRSTRRSAGSSAPSDEFLVFTNEADQRARGALPAQGRALRPDRGPALGTEIMKIEDILAEELVLPDLERTDQGGRPGRARHGGRAPASGARPRASRRGARGPRAAEQHRDRRRHRDPARQAAGHQACRRRLRAQPAGRRLPVARRRADASLLPAGRARGLGRRASEGAGAHLAPAEGRELPRPSHAGARRRTRCSRRSARRTRATDGHGPASCSRAATGGLSRCGSSAGARGARSGASRSRGCSSRASRWPASSPSSIPIASRCSATARSATSPRWRSRPRARAVDAVAEAGVACFVVTNGTAAAGDPDARRPTPPACRCSPPRCARATSSAPPPRGSRSASRPRPRCTAVSSRCTGSAS